MEVTWQAPQLVHHNGPILSYIIRYFPSNESDMAQDSHVTADNDETIQRKSLTNLEPFTRYSFRVSAVNGAGAGPFSVAVEGITEEHGEYEFTRILTSLNFNCIIYSYYYTYVHAHSAHQFVAA